MEPESGRIERTRVRVKGRAGESNIGGGEKDFNWKRESETQQQPRDTDIVSMRVHGKGLHTL